MRWSRAGLVKFVIIPASLGAGLIHFAVAPSHFEEYWLFGAFFLVAGLFQVATAALLHINPSRSLLATMGVVNGLIGLVWLASRTTGLPVGPDAFTAEEIGSADATSTVLEVLIVARAFSLLTTNKKGGDVFRDVKFVQEGRRRGFEGRRR